jgi:hypothetical protein
MKSSRINTKCGRNFLSQSNKIEGLVGGQILYGHVLCPSMISSKEIQYFFFSLILLLAP